MTTVTSSYVPVWRFADNNNNPLVGGKVYTYYAGTTTPAPTYTDASGTTQLTNPIILNARGETANSSGQSCSVWFSTTIAYKIVVQDSVGNLIWTVDNYTIPSQAYSSAYADTFTCTAGQTVFTLSGTVGSQSALDVSLDGSTLINGVDFTWTSPSTLTLTVGAKVNQVLLVKYLIAQAMGTMVAGGTPGQILYNNGGSVQGFTMSGDVTVVPTTGVATIGAPSSRITYTQGGTGATSRTVTSKLQESVSVKDFGAVGDGSTDDTTAIQNAINAGSYVYFPPGTYSVSNVTLTSNSYLYGAGFSSIIKQRTSGTFAMISADSGSSSLSSNLTGIVLRDLQLRGTVDTDGFSQFIYLLGLNGVTDAVIERVYFNGFRGDGFYLGSSYTAGVERHNQKVTVRSCVFDGINKQNRNCISVIDCDGLLVDDCEFRNSTSSTMPGAIDLEPNANSWAVIKNILIRANRFYNIGGNVAVVSLAVPSAVTAAPTNIVIEDNDFISYAGTGGFMNFNTNRTPSSSSTKNDIRVVGNNCISGNAAFFLYDGNRVTFRDNYFQDCTGPGYIGNTGGTNSVYDLEFVNNRMVRCGSAGAGIGLAVYTVTLAHFQSNKFIDCGTGSAGSSIAIDFVSGTSSNVRFDDNEFLSPTSKTLVAIQKEAGATFTASTNRFVGNTTGSLTNGFAAEESDVIETAYTCVITGGTTAGTGTYTVQYAYWKRLGKQVSFRIKLVVSAGHTGTGIIQIGLPTLAKTAPNNEETAVPINLSGVSSTGGQIGLINPALVVGGLGAIWTYATGTGTNASITIPAGAFTVWAAGSYMAA